MKCTEQTYLRAWRAGIKEGLEAGKLAKHNDRADLKTFTATPATAETSEPAKSDDAAT